MDRSHSQEVEDQDLNGIIEMCNSRHEQLQRLLKAQLEVEARESGSPGPLYASAGPGGLSSSNTFASEVRLAILIGIIQTRWPLDLFSHCPSPLDLFSHCTRQH